MKIKLSQAIQITKNALYADVEGVGVISPHIWENEEDFMQFEESDESGDLFTVTFDKEDNQNIEIEENKMIFVDNCGDKYKIVALYPYPFNITK